ncbi:hypothetical protein NH340_JMT06912 [Sarcoptes scabiei]|nr:NADH dehydrogenase [ubiquinone] 1 beta subcomplex subunit ESSS, mitochondrial-like protein [Sarcoptes scabiei]UXI20969.1 hypothetical protein NH340_JMT06912 [Sarcoptes scabiei]
MFSKISLIRSNLLARNALKSKIFNQNSSPQISSVISRSIKTTSKKDDHIEIYDPNYIGHKKPPGPSTAEEFADVSSQKNWVSHGFDEVDQLEDKFQYKTSFFFLFTFGCIIFSYALYYYPCLDGQDWISREAFLQLERNEKLGLPIIDPDLIDRSKMILPSDEELGDLEIHL